MLSFMGAFSGNHQISLYCEDQEKIDFITDRGLYCYKVMPFRLVNTGATYQRLVSKVFDHLVGNIMQVYVDDMIVKSVQDDVHNDYLREMFEILR